jgi:hypothetical protein
VQPTTEPTPAEMEKAKTWLSQFLGPMEPVRACHPSLSNLLHSHAEEAVQLVRAEVERLTLALAGEREARERAEQEAADALSLANEVALGITHSTICTPETLCVRCERDQVKAEVERLKADVHVRRGGAVTRA